MNLLFILKKENENKPLLGAIPQIVRGELKKTFFSLLTCLKEQGLSQNKIDNNKYE